MLRHRRSLNDCGGPTVVSRMHPSHIHEILTIHPLYIQITFRFRIYIGEMDAFFTDLPAKTHEARLLVVDDEPNIRDLLASSLRFAGFDVITAADGASAYTLATTEHPDLIVLDVMLPDMDGFQVTRRLREAGARVPVLLLTARDDMRDKIHGLTVGGDDYVTKPFGLEEVVARIRAILRRTAGGNYDTGTLVVSDLVLNEDAHEVHRADQQIDLSPTEFKLLRYLMINEGRVVSKMQILDHVWEYDWHGAAAIVESYISYLRRKLAVPGNSGEMIHTKRGVGYMLRAPEPH